MSISTAVFATIKFCEANCPELAKSLSRFMEGFTIQNVGDYKGDDQAATKMAMPFTKGAVLRFLPPVAVGPLNTKQGSFRIAMLALGHVDQVGDDVLFYLNVAPIGEQSARNGHHPLCVAVLTNGRIVVGPNAGHSFSFLKPYIKRLYVLSCDQEGKQFRSAAVFPQVILSLLSGDYSVIEEDATDRVSSMIPDFPQDLIADEDLPFENLRSPVTAAEFMERTGIALGDTGYVCRNGVPVAHFLFGKARGGKKLGLDTLSLGEGSNIIYPFGDERHLTYLDLFRVRGSAKRVCVMNVEDFRRMPFIGVPLEALAVFGAALRLGFPAAAVRGFCGVFIRRIGEWWRQDGEWERAVPVITFRKR